MRYPPGIADCFSCARKAWPPEVKPIKSVASNQIRKVSDAGMRGAPSPDAGIIHPLQWKEHGLPKLLCSVTRRNIRGTSKPGCDRGRSEFVFEVDLEAPTGQG